VKRVENWESKLNNFVQSSLGKPFKWGKNDCNVYGLECQDIILGTQYAKRIKGKFKGEKSAKNLQGKIGNLEQGLKAEGFQVVGKNFEQVGDIILIEIDGFMGGHICLGEMLVSVTFDRGVVLSLMRDLPEKYLTLRAPL